MDTPLYLNMLCADYDAVTPRVQLTFAPNLGVDPVTTCFDMDPLSLDGQIQRASIPLTGEALRCTPYEDAQSVSFDEVFQLETIEGANWWHGYLKVDFLDPWDGVNLESYRAIDFMELATNTDSFGVNAADRRFEEIRIGDIDGFGWSDGAALAALAAHDPAVASANDDLVNLPAKLPVNRDGFGLLASGDFLPDIDGDGKVDLSGVGDEPGDDWDRRSAAEAAGTVYTGSGFTRSAESFFALGSQYTDLTLSMSYSDSALTSDPVLTGDLARVYGGFPAADGESETGPNLPNKYTINTGTDYVIACNIPPPGLG